MYLTIYHVVKHTRFDMGNTICRCAMAHAIRTSFSHNQKMKGYRLSVIGYRIILNFELFSKSYFHFGLRNFNRLDVICRDGSHLGDVFWDMVYASGSVLYVYTV